ncbi:MAG TPA: nuclear transport factor 2 family protein [Chloroflexota bacterium]|jgi:hypothetical protein|nr:nuclear transport factor 2 family protein [Chloroflexota bacterium]
MRLRVSILLLCVLLALSVTDVRAMPSQRTAAATVLSTYYGLLNVAMQTGDFSAVVTAYAPDAVLTWSSALGVTTVFKGRAAIAGYYKAVYAKFPRLHFTLVGSEHNLSPSILLRYEKAITPSMVVPARCAHLFMIQSGLIASDDWVTYFPGK